MKNSYAFCILPLAFLLSIHVPLAQGSEEYTSILYGLKHRKYQVPPPTVALVTAQRAQKTTQKTACQLRTIERKTKSNETQGY